MDESVKLELRLFVIFKMQGRPLRFTKHSWDQGIDLISDKHKIIIQVKSKPKITQLQLDGFLGACVNHANINNACQKKDCMYYIYYIYLL